MAWRFAAACVITPLIIPIAYAANLSIPDQVANAGETVLAFMALSSGGQLISGVQFDVTWDQSLALEITIGARIRQSNKVLYTASPSPNVIRCLIVGMNQNALSDGELLRMFITLSPNAAPGLAHVALTNVSATAPDGGAVSLQPASANVQIQNGSASMTVLPSGVLNAASLSAGPVAPGELITLLGSLPTSPVVLFNGTAAPVLYAGNGQVNAVVPFGLDLSGPAKLQVRSQNQQIANISIPVAAAQPAIFTQNFTGVGPGTILNQDYTVNSSSNPAAPGSFIMVYGNGFGSLNPPAADGQIASSAAPTTAPVTATIGVVPAQVTYAGAAPGFISGVVQINVQIPYDFPPNLFAPISLSIGSSSTPAGVTVSIQ